MVFGKAGGFGASFDLANLNGRNGFVLQGVDTRDQSGFSVSSAGDVNGDGLADLIVGAVGADSKGQDSAGESYVVFGRRDFTAQVSSTGRLSEDALIGTAEAGILGDVDDPLLNGGTKTLQVDGRSLNLDLAALSQQDLPSTDNPLIVSGIEDKVTSLEQGWLLDGTTTLDSSLYNRYPVGATGLLVEATLSQTLT